MDDEYEVELEGSRSDVATALRDVADGLVAGSVRLGDGADAIAVNVPEELALEIELEADEDEIGLELEVEWSRAASGEDGITAVDATAGGNASGSAGGEASANGDDREASDLPGDASTEGEASSPVAAADGSRTMAGFELFRDSADEWRWRLRHRNGNIIATSGEGYTRKHNARKGLRSVMRNAPEAEVTDETEG